jgi:hypothetical protein
VKQTKTQQKKKEKQAKIISLIFEDDLKKF